jgi:hypothetical protein
LWTFDLARLGIAAVAEPFCVHLPDHSAHPLPGFYFSLWQQGEMSDFRASK